MQIVFGALNMGTKYQYRFAARQGWTRLVDLKQALASAGFFLVTGWDRGEKGPGAYTFWIVDGGTADPFPALVNPIVTGTYQVARLDSAPIEMV